MELSQKSLFDSTINYEYLLKTLNIVKSIIKSDNNGYLINNSPAVKILLKLFYGSSDLAGIWYNWTTNIGPPSYKNSGFNDLNIYYYSKTQNYSKTPWIPIIDNNNMNALYIANNNTDYNITTWKNAVDLLASYLGTVSHSPTLYTLENTLKVIKTLCELIIQRITIEKVLHKLIIESSNN